MITASNSFMSDGFASVKTTAKMLEKKVRTIRDWIYKGKIKAIKSSSGYMWMIPLSEINRVLYQEKEFEAIFSEGKQDAD